MAMRFMLQWNIPQRLELLAHPARSATGLPFFFAELPLFKPAFAAMRARNAFHRWRVAGARQR